MKKLNLLIVFISACIININAQIKIGKNAKNINPNSLLEMESDTMGMLLPRLNLVATNNFLPLKAHIEGMVVYNLATAGSAPNDVTPGYYYNDGTKWLRLVTAVNASGSGNLTNSNGIIVSNGTGATLLNTSLRIDSSALAKLMVVSPMKDSIVSISKSTTTNTLTSNANTMTNTTNGVSASASIVNAISNNFNATTRALTTTVNGVTGASVIIGSGIDSTSASNGLTLNGKEVRLGGTLTAPTSIITTATNSIAFSGLQSGANSDSILVSNPTSGVIARKSTASLLFGNTTNSLTAGSNSITNTTNGVSATLTPAAGTITTKFLGFDATGNLVTDTALTIANNIYNTDGSLTANRTMDMPNRSLSFSPSGTQLVNQFSVDGTTFSVDALNNRVGIGTTTPGESLDVRGNARIGNNDTSNYIAFRGLFADGAGTFDHTFIGERRYAGTEQSELLIYKGNDTGIIANDPGPDRIRLLAGEHRFDTYGAATAGSFETVARSTNNTNRMIIKGNGNVGIGTTAPNEKLDVDGNIRVGLLGTYSATATANYGKALLFGGAQGMFPTENGENSDPLWIARYNAANNNSELRVNIGDDAGVSGDKFIVGASVGTVTGFTGTTPYTPFFTVESTGNVGVGTTSPKGKLSIGTNGNAAYGNILLGSEADATNKWGSIASNQFNVNNTTNNKGFTMLSSSASSTVNNVFIGGGLAEQYAATSINFNTASNITTTTGSTRMTITGDGNVGIGTLTPSHPLHVVTSAPTAAFFTTTNSDPFGVINLEVPATNSACNNCSELIVFNKTGTGTIGTIAANLSGNSVSYNTTSDVRMKEDFKSSRLGINDLMKIQVSDYHRKGADKNTREVGFLAQQLYTIFPDAVTPGSKDDLSKPWMVDYGRITPLLVKSIQDQQLEIEKLKEIIAKLTEENINYSKNYTSLSAEVKELTKTVLLLKGSTEKVYDLGRR